MFLIFFPALFRTRLLSGFVDRYIVEITYRKDKKFDQGQPPKKDKKGIITYFFLVKLLYKSKCPAVRMSTMFMGKRDFLCP